MLLCKPKHGLLSFSSNLFKILTFSLHSSTLSPNPDLSISRNPKLTSRRPVSLSTRHPLQVSSNSVVISSDATTTCSMLVSDLKAFDFKDFDCLLKGYGDKLNSSLVLEVLRNYRELGRLRTLEFFSWAGRQMGFRFDDCVIEYMADFLGRRKLFDDMKCFLLTVMAHKGRFKSHLLIFQTPSGKDLTPTQIGAVLDYTGVAQINIITLSRMWCVLKAHELTTESSNDLYHLIKKAVAIN